jgi:phosphoribosyl 1,2-cyclic phosphodiesterase
VLSNELRSRYVKLTFMGTAGARFMVAKQLAASGGLYIEEGNTRISLDPGPGAIVQYAKRKVDLTKLDAIVISHRHLDHSNDVNVMIEAMTDGGFRHRGRLFCPSDALSDDPVVLQYIRNFPQEIVTLQPETDYTVGEVTFTTTPRHVHQVETFGFRFGSRLGWVTDSAYYDGIAEQHKADVMVIHLVLMECRAGLPHLCLDDAERIIREAKPRLAILTHYGMTVWRAHPWELAADLTQRIGTEVKAARDGMSVEL